VFNILNGPEYFRGLGDKIRGPSITEKGQANPRNRVHDIRLSDWPVGPGAGQDRFALPLTPDPLKTYTPVQKVLADPKVLQRGLAATEVLILYRGLVKGAPRLGRPGSVGNLLLTTCIYSHAPWAGTQQPVTRHRLKTV